MQLHDELGVGPEASQEDIQKAYRKRSKRAHPDAGGSEEQQQRLNHAYMVLRDPARRAHYEATGEENVAGVDQTRAQALAILGGLVQQALLDPMAAARDMLAAIRAGLKQESAQLAHAQKEHTRRRGMIERNAKRWRLKGGGEDDIVAQMAGAAMRECDRLIAECGRQIEVRALAAEMLDGYEYEADAPRRDPSAYRSADMDVAFWKGFGAT